VTVAVGETADPQLLKAPDSPSPGDGLPMISGTLLRAFSKLGALCGWHILQTPSPISDGSTDSPRNAVDANLRCNRRQTYIPPLRFARVAGVTVSG
jgi:hypothetical protein